MTDWLPPKAHYVNDHAARDNEERDKTTTLYNKLLKNDRILKEHDLYL